MHHEVVRGSVTREASLSVALGVVERDDKAGPAHRIKAGADGQPGALVGDGGQGRIGTGRAAVVGVELGHQGIALGGDPIHRLLCLANQVDQPGRVAAPDLVAAGHTVGGRQQ